MKLRASYPAFVLGVACAILFAQVWHYGLLTGDDNFNILYNPFIHPFTTTKLLRLWSDFYLKLYIPVTLTSWGLLSKAALFLNGTPEASVFHAANVFLHWLNGILVFFLLRDVSKAHTQSAEKNQHRDVVALLGALLFVCHPLQAGTVAWVTGLKDVLSALFGLLALHALLRADAKLNIKDRVVNFELGSTRWYFAATAAFALAILSKPNMIVLPLLGAVISAIMNKDWRGSFVATTPWLLAGLALALITSTYQADLYPGTLTPVWARPFAALDYIAFYVGKTLFPHPLPHEFGNRLTEVRRLAYPFWLSVFGCVLFFFGCWRVRNRLPVFFAGVLFAVIALLPVLGFIPYTHQQFCDVAARYMYFPMIGVCLCFVSIFQLLKWKYWPVIGTVVVIGFGVLGNRAVHVFADDDKFYGEILRYDPENHFALANYTVSLLRRHKHDQALGLALRDYQINPTQTLCLERVAEAFLALGRGPEAVKIITDVETKYGYSVHRQYALGTILILDGQWQAGVRELLAVEKRNSEFARMDPPAFAGELLDLHLERPGTLQALIAASQAAPHFISLQLLINAMQKR